MDFRACSKCGRVHPRGYKCHVGRKYNKTDDDKLRSTYAWTKKAKQIKDDANGLCEVCKAQGVYNYAGLEVHHITKVRENPDLLLDDDNLICLCSYHHKQADDGQIDTDLLKSLVKERGGLNVWNKDKKR